MHVKTLTSLSFWARLSSRKTKGRSESPNTSFNSRTMDPKLVMVREKQPSLLDLSTPSANGGPDSSARQRRAPDNNGLFVSVDVLSVIFSFTNIGDFSQCASACRNWNVMIKRAVQLNLREARCLLSRGLSMMAVTNTPTQSLALFTKALDLYPGLSEASFWKAKGLFIINKESKAIECLQSALTYKPTAVERLKLLACICYAQSNDLKASQFLEVAVQKAPMDASIHFELGFCYHGLLQFARAVECYTRALELKYERSFVLLANRANCYFRIGKVSNCLQDLEASLQISPNYELALRTRAFVNVQIGNPDQAHRDYTAIITSSTNPKSKSDAYCNRAFCYGDMDEDDIDRAHAADPTNPEPVRYKASTFLNQGNTAEAIDHMSSWIQANPSHKDLGHQVAFRAELYTSMDELEAAIMDYKTAIHVLTNSPVAMNNAGCSTAETIATYQDRLQEIIHEQRGADYRS